MRKLTTRRYSESASGSTKNSAISYRSLRNPLRCSERDVRHRRLSSHYRTVGSNKIMKRKGRAYYRFSFHNSDEVGPAILFKIAEKSGFEPSDL